MGRRKKEDSEAPRVGRPVSDNPASSTFQMRVRPDRRAAWQATAAAAGQTESDWARDGLDAWERVCERAAEIGTNPSEVLRTALEDHARVRAAIAELELLRSRSTTEDRVFRMLSPSAWAKKQPKDADAG